MAMYGDISQLSAGTKYGIQRPSVTEPFVAKSNLGFGKAAFGYKGNPDEAWDIQTDKNTVTYSADFVDSNVIAFSVNGEAIDPVTFDTDQATTAALLVAAVQALDEEYEVSFASRVITVTTPGTSIVLTSAVTGGATQATATVGTAEASGDYVFLGAVMKAQKAPTLDADSGTGYVVGEMLEVMRSGYLVGVVDAIANCEENAPVYVITSGSNKGKFTGTSTSNLAINATFRFFADGSQALAVIDFQQLPKAVA